MPERAQDRGQGAGAKVPAQPSAPETDDSRDNRVGLSLHGPGASIEDAIRAGEALKGLLAAVGEEMGMPEGAVTWAISSIQFKCDGCGLLRADRPGPDEGWTYRDGDDLCPACSGGLLASGDPEATA